MRQWVALIEQAAVDELERDPRLADLDWLKRFIVQQRDEHKSGKQKGVSLAKNPPAALEPLLDGPVEILGAAE